jgi:acyl-CoA hydrolase
MKNNTERQASSADDACWAAKEIQLGDVAHKISNGSNIYIGSAASTAEATLKQLVQSPSSLQDIQILQMVPGGNLPHLKENPDQFRTRTFFSFSKTPFHMPNNNNNNNNNNGNNDDDEASSNDNKLNNNNNNESLADYTPMSVSAVPRLLREKQLQVDVAIIKVTEPHKVLGRNVLLFSVKTECVRPLVANKRNLSLLFFLFRAFVVWDVESSLRATLSDMPTLSLQK